MNHSPRLSIITVNLNNRAGLEKTIQSVVKQTFTEYEFIIIDGGSNDGSVEAIRSLTNIPPGRYMSQSDPSSQKLFFPFTYWISEPDSGIYNAMNKGVRIAKGTYCLFLNSGDWLVDIHSLKKIFNQTHSEDLLIAGCRVSKNGYLIHIVWPPPKLTMASFYRRTIPHQSTFIKRLLFEKFGLYSEEYKIHGDYEFWIRTIILNDCSIKPIPIIISDYNMEGISSQQNNKDRPVSEVQTILSNAIPHRILEDYKAWHDERNEMKALYWVNKKPLLLYPIKAIYFLAQLIVKIRR
jgi:glycosyltransferase involved in cell wall biosynthesis